MSGVPGSPPSAGEPTALVTGGSRGLGRALAGWLAGGGMRIVITGRDPAALDRARAELASHTSVTAVPGDVADPAHRHAVTEAVGGRLDLLVHNASILGPSPLPPLAATPLDAVREVLEVNLIAPLALTQALLPALRACRGRVVWISSDAARGGYPGWGTYGASKAALDLVAATLAHEHPELTSVSVDPGDMRTRMHQQAFPGEDISDRPEPEATLPFFAWLLEQDGTAVTGRRFEAQGDAWTLDPPQEGAA